MIKTKRTYDKPQAGDGLRILVDRIWPRGLKKTEFKMDLWQKDISPSSLLRKWFNHDESKWDEFKNRYYNELQDKKESIGLLLEKARSEEHTSELQSRLHLVCRLLLEKKKKKKIKK